MAPIIKPTQGGGGSENPPSNNLWIGNIATDVTDPELKSLLEKHGKVDSITSYPTRNYAFVYFKELDGAKSAKENLQGHEFHGMNLKIEFAKPAKPCKSLWVAGINQSAKEEVEKEFQKFGNVQEFRFLRDKSNAYVDFEKLEDATQALRSMNGRRIGGGQLRVDFLRSQSSRREQGSDARDGQFFGRNMGPTDFRWIGQDPLNHRAGPGLAGSKRQHQLLSAQISRVLLISHPPSVVIEKDMLHNAMILFGEIERILTLPERNYAYVEFRSAEEANRAKEGLQGKLFNDPRISIEFSSSEFPIHPDQMGILGMGRAGIPGNNTPALPAMGIRGPSMGLRTGFEASPHGSEFSPQSRIGGQSWRRSSPTNGVGSSPSAGTWDGYASSQLHRDSKRLRYDSAIPLDGRDGFNEQYGLSSPSTFGASGSVPRVTIERDCIWRGLITKGGVPVCRARCVPFGEDINLDLPNPVDISAKTGLEALTTHYEKATGFQLVFFLPDSEADFQSYTELLLFLGSKNRAGVVKFDDGSNLFLVPPDFLTEVLHVSGPERLYGVVLKFPEVAPIATPANVQSVHPQHAENRWASSQIGYSAVHQDQRAMPPTNSRYEEPMLPSRAQPHAVAQPAVTLTPELIASLTSLLPAKTGSSGPQMPALPQAPVPGPSAAGAGHQSSSQLVHAAQGYSQGLPPPPPPPSGHYYQPVSSYGQTQRSSNLVPDNTSQQYQPGHTGGYAGQGTDHWTDSSRFYNPSMVQQQGYSAESNQAYGVGISQPQSYTPMPADQPISHQSEQLQSGTQYGSAQESAETEADKNERYKSTLLLAANLLSRLHQPSSSQQGQGSSGH